MGIGGDTLRARADDIVQDLVTANRALATEGILDAYGHVSVRDPANPDQWLMSRALPPGMVEAPDILAFDLTGQPVDASDEPLYLERFIHAAVFSRRPDVMAVCHNHLASILPFSVSASARLRAVIHSAAFVGEDVPVWDIADEFGTGTNLRVENIEQGRSLARAMGDTYVTLMRGHGSVVVSHDIRRLVRMCVALDRNAVTLLAALQLGDVVPLHPGEIARRAESSSAGRRDDDRAWRHYKHNVETQEEVSD